jgi:hypothetical protein
MAELVRRLILSDPKLHTNDYKVMAPGMILRWKQCKIIIIICCQVKVESLAQFPGHESGKFHSDYMRD